MLPRPPETPTRQPDGDIVSLVELAKATLMTDPTWLQLFEGIERLDVRYAYPAEAENFQIGALIEFVLTFASTWPPFVPNPLSEFDVTLRLPNVPYADGGVMKITFEDAS